MRIQITGSRDFTSQEIVHDAIVDRMVFPFREGEPVTVVHGGAKGADSLAGEAMRDYSWVTVEVHPADWDRYGKSAGYRRNAEMIALNPDVVLAFKKLGSGNKGTQHTIDIANKAGVPVIEYWEEA